MCYIIKPIVMKLFMQMTKDTGNGRENLSIIYI